MKYVGEGLRRRYAVLRRARLAWCAGMHVRTLPPAPVLLVGLLLSSCRSTETLRQRCLSQDLSACESACSKHLYGEGGCFHAGQQYRTRAGLDFGSADFRHAQDYFRRSCEGKFADGCVLFAELIERPFGETDVGSDLPKTMPERTCATTGKSHTGALELSLTVDRTGDVFRRTLSRSELSSSVAACAKSLIGLLTFTPPTGGYRKRRREAPIRLRRGVRDREASLTWSRPRARGRAGVRPACARSAWLWAVPRRSLIEGIESRSREPGERARVASIHFQLAVDRKNR